MAGGRGVLGGRSSVGSFVLDEGRFRYRYSKDGVLSGADLLCWRRREEAMRRRWGSRRKREVGKGFR